MRPELSHLAEVTEQAARWAGAVELLPTARVVSGREDYECQQQTEKACTGKRGHRLHRAADRVAHAHPVPNSIIVNLGCLSFRRGPPLHAPWDAHVLSTREVRCL